MPLTLGTLSLVAGITGVVAAGYIADAAVQLDERTRVPITVVCTVAACAWLSARWVTTLQDKLLEELKLHNQRLKIVEEIIQKLPCKNGKSQCDPNEKD